MRLGVSVGVAVLAALWLAGDVAGGAAPDPSLRRAAEDPNVDVELILAVDVSRSMDLDELALQREGYAQALVSSEFLKALKSGPNGKIAITYFEWARMGYNRVVVPWRIIDGPESADAVSAAIAAAPISQASETSISGAINFSMQLFAASNFRSMRRVIDISGDGPNNNGPLVTDARQQALDAGVTINGLPIMIKQANSPFMTDIENLDLYYEDCVIGGAGSFVIAIKSRDKFKEAIRTKLVLEVAGLKPEMTITPAANMEPRISCTIGEQMWRRRGWGGGGYQ
jgi:hypothetical protein